LKIEFRKSQQQLEEAKRKHDIHENSEKALKKEFLKFKEQGLGDFRDIWAISGEKIDFLKELPYSMVESTVLKTTP
jgi:hypothetical protein